jgi:nucleoside-triphosphatase THEP1
MTHDFELTIVTSGAPGTGKSLAIQAIEKKLKKQFVIHGKEMHPSGHVITFRLSMMKRDPFA